ncbi:MAG: hypothetical protein ACE5OY_04685 [Candidatus Bathyarchaeia archaeon]
MTRPRRDPQHLRAMLLKGKKRADLIWVKWTPGHNTKGLDQMPSYQEEVRRLKLIDLR